MSNIRASGYGLKDRDDDESFQMLIGDVERLTIALRKGADIGPNGSTVGGSAESAGALLAVNNLSDVLDAAEARINLGITDSGGGSLFLQVSNNLSDLNSAATARTNLGLGTIATQNANSVAITGGSVTGITDLTIADGGTGSSTASGARTNLGLGTMATQSSGSVFITGGSVSATSGTFSGLTSVSMSGVNGVSIAGTEVTALSVTSSSYKIPGATGLIAEIIGDASTSTTAGFSFKTGSSGSTAVICDLSSSSTLEAFSLFIGGSGKTQLIRIGGTGTGTFTIGGSLTVDVAGIIKCTGVGDLLGFFGSSGTAKVSVSDPPAITTTGTANAVYDATEQNMLNDLKTDVTNLRTALLALTDALQGYNLV